MSGPSSLASRLTVSRLVNMAVRHARESTADKQTVVAELAALANDRLDHATPPRPTELLSMAAGQLVGGYRYSPISHTNAPTAARLLVAAGADLDLVDDYAAITVARLRRTEASVGA